MRKFKDSNGLRIVPVNLRGETAKEVKRIYYSAFEKHERMNYTLMLLMSKLWHTDVLAFFDGETLCGFISMASLGRLTFVLFFAVDEQLRSKGYGTRILAAVREIRPKNKVIVSIELVGADPTPQNVLRARRRCFYQRCGFAQTGYSVTLAGIKQELLVANGEFSKAEFIAFFMFYSSLAVIPRVEKMPAAENTPQ